MKASLIISDMLPDHPFSMFLGWITLGAVAIHGKNESLR